MSKSIDDNLRDMLQYSYSEGRHDADADWKAALSPFLTKDMVELADLCEVIQAVRKGVVRQLLTEIAEAWGIDAPERPPKGPQ